MGREEALRQAQQALSQPSIYLFKQQLLNLQKNGVSKDDDMIKKLLIMIVQTCSSCRDKKINIDKKYEKKMQILSILSCFAGKNTCSLGKLEKELGINRQRVLELLVEASIYKLVKVEIDEENGNIRIWSAKIREREMVEDIDKNIVGRILLIKEKNNELQKEITDIVGVTKPPKDKITLPYY